ncbi:TonB-dependent receptor [Fulvivirga kasyanovii]|uniref:TonB-dependent receptor n=1 Tax=Fulvivirga kasyanovii TaxID=396812 RepID=A0ABW9RS35_9BACT|nr:TonB-dependent receptor [Fulvivirga kasyanovii]MTI26118.1 TonB-dependent receptor [Fulvivirga kasyanovii]
MLKYLLSLMLALAVLSGARAQTTVSGKVTSADDGQPLPGVNILVENTTKGTVTDIDGNYSLSLNEDENVIIFSFIGFATQSVNVNGRSVIDVSMESDITSLNEIVIVGYGTQEEKDLTSAIATVKAEEIQKTPTSQAMQALQGKVAGVQIVSRGEPGEGPKVRVRGVGSLQGNSDPLYVVDGMFFDNIDFLNTADIASISVLKDASAAAIYGVRAANGVVLIETKSGSYDQAPQIVYDGYYGVQVPQNVIKMANSEQFSQYVRETGSSADIAFLNAAFQRYGRSRVNPNVPDVNTDWYDEVLQTAPIQNHSITISGGGENSRYAVGASYFDQEGLLKHTRNDYERFNFRSKVDFDATNWLNVGGNVNISNATRYVADNAVWFKTYFAVPILPVYDDQNTDAEPFSLSNAKILGYRNSQNPFYDLLYNDDRFKVTKILANFYADFEIIPNKLSFKTSYNYNFGSVNQRTVDFAYHDGLSPVLSGIKKQNTTSLDEIWDNILTFNENIGAHSFSIMGGYSYRSETADLLFAKGTELNPSPNPDNEEYWYIDNGAIDVGEVGDFDDENNDLGKFYGTSYFGRISYNYDDRYLIYGTFRRDGTNKFQEKWGNFPTVGVGWVLSEESFFDVKPVNFLKLRASWGKLGNDSSPAAVGKPTLVGTETAIDGILVLGNEADVFYDLLEKWETTEETNIGITARFLEDRLSLEADYYIRDTEDAALPIVLPLVRDQIRRNRGVIRNSGLELALNWSDNISEDLSYSIGGNLATLKNEVRDLGGQPYLNAGQQEFRQRSIIGEPIEAFFGYEVEGVFQNEGQISSSGLTQEFIDANNIIPGDFRFKDQNNDGVIDDLDRVVLGSYLPKLTYGFNIGVNYKNIELTANFQGQTGHSILNRKRGEMLFTTDTNIDADLADNLWRGEGTSNEYPSAAGLRKAYNLSMSDYFVEDGSYFRIQNVRLAYSLINRELFGAPMPDVRITLTAERPLTVFDYNGFNPEVADGIDRQTYPIPGIYTIGLNIKL